MPFWGTMGRKCSNLLSFFMRFSKQVSQIVHLADKFNDDEPYPVGMTVNGIGGYTRDAAGGFEFSLCSSSSVSLKV